MFGGKECALSDAFDTDQPWGSRKVTLVSLKRGSDGQMWSFLVSWDSGSSDRLCYKASDPKDVVKFLNNPDGKCFLFPDDHMGPDLSCFVQDVVTKELVFLCLQSKISVQRPLWVPWHLSIPNFSTISKYVLNVSLCLLIL